MGALVKQVGAFHSGRPPTIQISPKIGSGSLHCKCPINFSLSRHYDKLKLIEHQTDPLLQDQLVSRFRLLQLYSALVRLPEVFHFGTVSDRQSPARENRNSFSVRLLRRNRNFLAVACDDSFENFSPPLILLITLQIKRAAHRRQVLSNMSRFPEPLALQNQKMCSRS